MKRLHLSNLSVEWKIILGFAASKLLIHLLTNTNYELHRDAYLYLAQLDHPAFGYASIPPLLSVIGNISRFLFGESVFAVRLFPVLIGVASLILIGMIVLRLKGNRWALVLACAAFLFSGAYLRTNTLFQPVAFNQFFWVLSCYWIIALLQTQNPLYWLHIGVTWGLGFLNKYSIVFFALAFFLALLLTPERRLLWSKYTLYGIGIGFLIILPNLLWQHAHNWPVVTHMATLQRTQLVNVSISGFLLTQVMMNLHAVILWLAGLVWLIFSERFRTFRALGFTYLTLVGIMLIFSGKAYYILGIYPLLFVAGAIVFSEIQEKFAMLKPAILTLMLLISLPALPYGLPILPLEKMLNYANASKNIGLDMPMIWEDGEVHDLPQDYADMIGWRDLSEIVIKAYQQLKTDKKQHIYIYASNYGQAGAIKYHGKKHGLPEPVSFNDSFLFWAPDHANADILIYVNDELGQDIQTYFADIREVGVLSNRYAREKGTKVFICKSPRPEFENYYQTRVADLKRHYR